MGRPSEFTAEVAATICERLADGESLRTICSDETMPGKSTVFQWLAANSDFADQYARARQAQSDVYVDEIVDIADTEVDAQKARVRIDARKWHASKVAPKKYGDRVVTEHTGADGGPIQYENMTPEARAARIAELEAKRRGTEPRGGD